MILDDTNFLTGEKSSDIYIKGFLCDKVMESQKTDIHYRSLDGEGNFNWRFIFNFDYLPAEQAIIYSHKERFGLVNIERKMKPKFTLQCYDSDQLSKDDLLGEINLDLCKLIKGSSKSDSCTHKMFNDNWPKINLFKLRTLKGWWPFHATAALNQTKKITVILTNKI